MGAVVKIAVRPMIPGNGFVQIVRPNRVFSSVVSQRWHELVADDVLNGRPPRIVLAATGMMRRTVNPRAATSG